jgi:mono/diheme cytochrome c family protein
VSRGRGLAWLAAGALALAAGALAAALGPRPAPPPGPEPGRTLFGAHCAGCHGPDGRGRTWRARLFLLRPGDLAGPAAAGLPDQYLADLVRHGGASYGKPGMPSFGFVLGDAEVEGLVRYLRSLGAAGGGRAG